MVLSECYSCIKYLLLFVNVIFWAVGLTAVVLAVWMLTDQTFLVSIAQEQQNFTAGLYILLVAGAFMIIVSFVGCCGAFRESQCLLVSFFSCLLVIVVAEIAAGAWLCTSSDRLVDLVRSSVHNTVKNEYEIDKSRTQIIDSIQSGLECCGAAGPADWAGSKYGRKDALGSGSTTMVLTVSAKTESYQIPESCCKERGTRGCTEARLVKPGGVISPDIYHEGCMDKLVEALKNQRVIVIGVTIAVGILELLGLILSLVFCCAIGSSDRYKA